eukprot:scpid97745/ scgid30518/ 
MSAASISIRVRLAVVRHECLSTRQWLSNAKRGCQRLEIFTRSLWSYSTQNRTIWRTSSLILLPRKSVVSRLIRRHNVNDHCLSKMKQQAEQIKELEKKVQCFVFVS